MRNDEIENVLLVEQWEKGLRVGNIVEYYGAKHRIHSEEDLVNIRSKVKPLLLNDPIIEMLGFKQRKDDFAAITFLKIYNHPDIVVKLQKDDRTNLYNFYTELQELKQIYSVDQLQNLTFYICDGYEFNTDNLIRLSKA